MKTKEELEQIKEKYTELNKKLADLSEDELEQVSGGAVGSVQFFNEDKGLGLIKPGDGGRDIFTHPKGYQSS